MRARSRLTSIDSTSTDLVDSKLVRDAVFELRVGKSARDEAQEASEGGKVRRLLLVVFYYLICSIFLVSCLIRSSIALKFA